MIEEPIHDYCPGLHYRSQLVAVDQLGDRSAAVADQLRYLLERHAGIRQH